MLQLLFMRDNEIAGDAVSSMHAAVLTKCP